MYIRPGFPELQLVICSFRCGSLATSHGRRCPKASKLPLTKAVRGLWLAHPKLGPKPLLAKLLEQQLDLEAGNKEVHEALLALKGKSEATDGSKGVKTRTGTASRRNEREREKRKRTSRASTRRARAGATSKAAR